MTNKTWLEKQVAKYCNDWNLITNVVYVTTKGIAFTIFDNLNDCEFQIEKKIDENGNEIPSQFELPKTVVENLVNLLDGNYGYVAFENWIPEDKELVYWYDSTSENEEKNIISANFRRDNDLFLILLSSGFLFPSKKLLQKLYDTKINDIRKTIIERKNQDFDSEEE